MYLLTTKSVEEEITYNEFETYQLFSKSKFKNNFLTKRKRGRVQLKKIQFFIIVR